MPASSRRRFAIAVEPVATMDDIAAVHRLRDVFPSLHASLEGPAPHDTVLVARRRGSIIGTAAYSIEPTSVYIHDVVVEKRFRGRGVGTALMHALVAAAEAAGYERVYLLCTAPLIPFYERLGYTLTDISPGYAHGERRINQRR